MNDITNKDLLVELLKEFRNMKEELKSLKEIILNKSDFKKEMNEFQDEIRIDIELLKGKSDKLFDHIDFIEECYGVMKKPLDYVSSYFYSDFDNKKLPELKNNKKIPELTFNDKKIEK